MNAFRLALLSLFIAATLFVNTSSAVLPDEMMSDPKLEARALLLSRELRCVVCQNQSIDESAAPIARDMRLLLRERLAAGDSDKDAVVYLVQRYGNYVLLKPPFQPDTWLLWFAPFAVLILSAIGMFFSLKKRRMSEMPAPLSQDEEKRLATIMDKLVPGGGQ